MEPAVQPDFIAPNLYLGCANSARVLHVLETRGITHILMVGNDLVAHYPSNIQYQQLEIQDTWDAPLEDCLERGRAFIQTAVANGGTVLVHCQAGVSRSASVVIYYLMRTHQISYEEALRRVREKRPRVKPNAGFEAKLRAIL